MKVYQKVDLTFGIPEEPLRKMSAERVRVPDAIGGRGKVDGRR